MNQIFMMGALMLLSIVGIATSMTIQGSVPIQENAHWLFLDKFCLEEDGASIAVNVDFSLSPNTLLLFYSDLDTKWGRVAGSDLSCHEKIAHASTNISIGSAMNTGKAVPVDQRRDRWWYFVLANCEEPINIPFYQIVLKNSGTGINSVLSADQQNIPQAQLALIIFFMGLTIATIINWHILRRLVLETKVMRLFIAVLGFKVLGLFINLIFWSLYFMNGQPNYKINVGGDAIQIIAHSLFILLLLLLAQGWTVSHTFVSRKARAVSAVLFFGILIFSLTVYLVPNATFMPENTYILFYDTVPGYVLLAFFLSIFIYFLVCIKLSHSQHQDTTKKRFFILVGVLFALWFLALPMLVTLGHFIASWQRLKAVTLFTLIVDAIFYLALILVFRASVHNPYVFILNIDQNPKGVMLEERADGASPANRDGGAHE
eukprot:gene245-298_t